MAGASRPYWLLSEFDRYQASSYLDFIGALIRHRDMEAHRTPGLSSSEDIARDPSRFHIRMLQQSELLEENPKERAEEKSKRLKAIQQGEPIPGSFSFDDQARRLLEWEYPYRELTAIRTKQSVSELKRKQEYEDEYSGLSHQTVRRHAFIQASRFYDEKGLTAAEKERRCIR